jgi:hypothetical protein
MRILDKKNRNPCPTRKTEVYSIISLIIIYAVAIDLKRLIEIIINKTDKIKKSIE